MRKPHSHCPLTLTAPLGLMFLVGCFSATPTRPAKPDASGNDSDSLRTPDVRTADDAITDNAWTRQDTGVLSEDAMLPSLDAPGKLDAATDIPQSSPDLSGDIGGTGGTTGGDGPAGTGGTAGTSPPDASTQPADAPGTCSKATDCPGPCQTCSGHMCILVAGVSDPSGRCLGTCDASGTCKSKQGQTCKVSADCVSGTSCSSDGHCCDKACNGPCEACDSGTGICTPVTGKPHAGHSGCAGASAACEGSCTGAADGQCTWPSSACGQATCETLTNSQSQATGTNFVAQGTCSAGACVAPPATSCPKGLICASSAACKTACSLDSDCLAGNTCSLGTCVGKKDIGASCTKGSDCLLGNCVDGFCCESQCTGPCQACSAAKTGGTDGRCRMVSAGTDPDSECSVDTGNQCGRDGTCDGLGACRLQVLGTACGNPSCNAGMLTPAGQCNGGGACIPATAAAPCPGNLLCANSTSCATTCTDRSTGGCPIGKKCVNGTTCTAATVACGGTSCPVANGGAGCCATDPNSTGTNAVLTCMGPTETCSTGSLIPCNSGAECPSGQICCAKGNNCRPGTWDLHCQADASDCLGGVASWGYQVCDPSLSPTECLSGTCEPSDCIPGISVCSHN